MQYTTTVVTNVKLNSRYFVLTVQRPAGCATALPGQFFSLTAKAGQKLWAPISLYSQTNTELGFMIRIEGPKTQTLAALQPGQQLQILGPRGNSFALPSGKTAVMVSGGVGYPPLAFLQQHLQANNQVYWLHGGRTKSDVFDGPQQVFTDDGSHGRQGLVTIGLQEQLSSGQVDVIYACGPTPLLKAVQQLASQAGITAWLSLEAYMACAIGVCKGCVVPIMCNNQRVYKTVCQDGPIFNATEVCFD